MLKRIWISERVLHGDRQSGSTTSTISEFRTRAYELWNHANNLIMYASNSLQLDDGIINLKRSINHRLKTIERLFKFKENNLKYKKIHYLEILEQIGIIRPSMLKILLEIRNNIEHNDCGTPDKNRCQELSDMVWYFLKSTDFMISKINESVRFNEYDEISQDYNQYEYELNIDYSKPLEIKLEGWFKPTDIYDQEREKCFCVYGYSITAKEKYPKEIYQFLETDIYVKGCILSETINLEEWLKEFFYETY